MKALVRAVLTDQMITNIRQAALDQIIAVNVIAEFSRHAKDFVAHEVQANYRRHRSWHTVAEMTAHRVTHHFA